MALEAAVQLGDVFEPSELEYVQGVLGPYRIDVVSYRGATFAAAALERLYTSVPALANPDSDGIFTAPELVTLLRTNRGVFFQAWAEPSKRTD